MANEINPAPKRKYLRAWLIISLGLLLPTVYFIWRASNQPAKGPEMEPIGHAIISIFIGGFFLVMGFCFYLVVLFTHAFTFNFNQSVWDGVKMRMFLANIFVPVTAMIGIGFLLSSVMKPVLDSFNLPGNTSFMLPVMTAVIGLQIVLLFVLIWSPLEKSVINRRLAALGVTPEQMQNGLHIGISNPAITSSVKRRWCIEEDVGMLWFTPGQLVYWGDKEQFGITREQLIEMERKTDAKSTTALVGTAHVILHILQADGTIRQMRLHTEGVWTMLGKRTASDNLAARITAWQNVTQVPAQTPAA
jgi:hypothetical protein